jgi:hypothetical protein
MADVLESLSTALSELISGGRPKVIVSDAPGAGPESESTGHRVAIEAMHNGRLPLGYLAQVPGKGRSATGYGGSGDAITVDEHEDEEVRAAVREAARIASIHKPVANPPVHERVRLQKWYWLESHTENPVGPTVGPYSLFDGTTGVPSAGNSVQTIPIALPAGTLSPVYLLDRYPGAMYMSLFISSFAFIPIGSTATGVQEFWFTDAGGAVAALGMANAATGDGYSNINKQLSSPLTDPGLTTLGTLTVNNISLGGTPVACRYQIGIGYVAGFADPSYNEHMLLPLTPAQKTQQLWTMSAQGN